MSFAAMPVEMLTHCPPPLPIPVDVDREPDAWTVRMPIVPVMRSFPRLAVEPDEQQLVEARFDEEPERWDGMA